MQLNGSDHTPESLPPTELWPNIAKALCPDTAASCPFEPVFVQIDNDPADAAQHLVNPSGDDQRTAPAPPNELLVPFQGLQSSQGGQADGARARACLLFSQEGQWVHLAVAPLPGAAPPLGWVLSSETRQGLRDQLVRSENRAALDKVRGWLDQGVPGAGGTIFGNPTASC